MNETDFKKQLAVLTAGMFCMSASYNMMAPFLPVYLTQLGISPTDLPLWTGIIFSVTFFVGAVMAPVWGRFSDLFGRKTMCLRSMACVSISYLLAAAVNDPYQLLAARVINGFANGYMPAAMALLTSAAPDKRMGEALGFFLTGQLLGHICGPVFGGIVSHFWGIRASMIMGAVILLAMTVLIFIFVKSYAPVQKTVRRIEDAPVCFSRVWRKPVLLEMLFCTFSFQCVILMMQSGMAVHLADLSGEREAVELKTGIILGLGGAAGALSSAFWGRRGQMHGYFCTMAITLFFSGTAMFFQGLTNSVWIFGFLQFVEGLFLMGTMPSLNAVIAEHCAPEFRGRMFGMNAMMQQSGNMTGPLVTAMLLSWAGSAWIFMTGGLILMVLSLHTVINHEGKFFHISYHHL